MLQIESPHHKDSCVQQSALPHIPLDHRGFFGFERSGIDAFRPLMESPKITKVLLGQQGALLPCGQVILTCQNTKNYRNHEHL